MTNNEYVTSLIKSNDRIYIDTSALMNVPELKLFTENIEDILVEEEKKIIVPSAVILELLRHNEGPDQRKKEIATKVFDILYTYDNIFAIENVDAPEIDYMKIFADAKLLAELTEKKSSCRQMLITNDRKLGHDAYDLNNLESCKGYGIKVCYLNKYGELHRCDCAKESAVVAETEVKSEMPVKETIKYVPVKVETESGTKTLQLMIPITTLVVGFVAGKYGKNLLNVVSNIA